VANSLLTLYKVLVKGANITLISIYLRLSGIHFYLWYAIYGIIFKKPRVPYLKKVHKFLPKKIWDTDFKGLKIKM